MGMLLIIIFVFAIVESVRRSRKYNLFKSLNIITLPFLLPIILIAFYAIQYDGNVDVWIIMALSFSYLFLIPNVKQYFVKLLSLPTE